MPLFLHWSWKAIAAAKDAWVKEVWCGPEEGEGWKLIFIRPFNNWEMEEVEKFLACIDKFSIVNDVEDKLHWKKPRKTLSLRGTREKIYEKRI